MKVQQIELSEWSPKYMPLAFT